MNRVARPSGYVRNFGRQGLQQIRQERFAFYDAYGQPSGSTEARAAFRALPFGTRFRMNTNIWAFLFGPIYYFVKGMWRKGLVAAGDCDRSGGDDANGRGPLH
jgi:hypothetical protein